MQIEEDFKAIKNGLKLLEYDYIGGHGTRGYGKIKFNNVDFPAPDGPSITTNSPLFIDKSILSSALNSFSPIL